MMRRNVRSAMLGVAIMLGMTAVEAWSQDVESQGFDDADGPGLEPGGVGGGNTSDQDPPGAPLDFSGTSPTARSIRLEWTAPPENGAASTGTSTTYDVRFWIENPLLFNDSNAMTVEDSFRLRAHAVEGAPVPAAPGSVETVTIQGIYPGSTRWFALRAIDDAGNEGPLSAVIAVTAPPDTLPPSAVEGLSAGVTGFSKIRVEWQAPVNDAGDPLSGRASAYDLRYSLLPIVNQAIWDAAVPISGEPAPAAPGVTQSMVVDAEVAGMAPATSFHLGMVAFDERGQRGPFSNSPMLSLPGLGSEDARQAACLGAAPAAGRSGWIVMIVLIMGCWGLRKP